jgi:protoheme IX farnesyltransferase
MNESSKQLLKAYYQLAKPGIIRGNVITLIAGFLLGSQQNVNLGLLAAAILGSSLMIASGCVFNNYVDRAIDKKMARTKSRALVIGLIPENKALIYAGSLGVAGTIVLTVWTNTLTVMIGIMGLVFYVVVYGIAKRRTVHGTLVGSISGAIPPVAGYTAATERLDLAALLLFTILVLWQMPHFYSIAIFRNRDYAEANIPVLPLVKGVKTAKRQILIYIAAYIVAVLLLFVFGYAGYLFAVIAGFSGLFWLLLGLKKFGSTPDNSWARMMFSYSLAVILLFSISLSIESTVF